MAHTARRRTIEELRRDIVWYLAIGAAVAAFALWYAVYLPPEIEPDRRWVGLVVMTPVTFGVPFSSYRRYWRVWRFWLAFVALLSIHLIAFIVLLKGIAQFGLLSYVILNPLEWVVIYPVLDWVVKHNGKPRRLTM